MTSGLLAKPIASCAFRMCGFLGHPAVGGSCDCRRELEGWDPVGSADETQWKVIKEDRKRRNSEKGRKEINPKKK